MNKTKAFINTVVILAILFYVAGCTILTVEQAIDYTSRASKLRYSFDILQSEHTGDQQMATLRNQFDNEDKLLQTAINKTDRLDDIPTPNAEQQSICEKHLAAMNKLFTDATGLYPSPTLSGSASHANPSAIPFPPPSDDDIAIDAAPANNTTQEIQFGNQGQQGVTNITETPTPPPPPIISPPIL